MQPRRSVIIRSPTLQMDIIEIKDDTDDEENESPELKRSCLENLGRSVDDFSGNICYEESPV